MKIEKYNQVVWATLGTMAVLGVVAMVLVSVVSIIASRQSPQGIKVEEPAPGQAERKTETKIVYGDPIVTEHSPFVMIPVGLQEVSKGRLVKLTGSYYSYGSSFSKASYIYYGLLRGRYNNIVFYSKNTGQSHVLLDRKAVISSFYFPYGKEDKTQKPLPKFLLFGISEDDTNGDGVISEEDAVVVYLADLDGGNFQQVTPSNTQLIGWEIDQYSGMIFLRLRKDSDNDKEFTEEDDMSVFKVDARMPGMGVEIIGEPVRKRIESIIFG